MKQEYSAAWWASQISQAENRHQKFFQSAKESIKMYKAATDVDDILRKLNVWWYTVNTLLPAYYSSTPKAEVNLRKRVGGMKYQIGSILLERNTQFAMDEHFDFDIVGYNAALQFLLTGRGILWARYEAEIEEEMVEFAAMQTPQGLVDINGKPFQVDEKYITNREGGIVSGQMPVEKKDDERAILETVQYDDFLTSDARNESEIEWKSRRAYLSEREATELFGKDVAKKLKYDSFPEELKSNNRATTEERGQGKAELREIWCRESEKVYWLQKNGKESVLESGDVPVEFEGFWPCSVINQSVDPDSVIPVSDYVHGKDQIIEIERLTTRIAATIQAIRTNALYDQAMGDEVQKMLEGDLKFIPVANWPSYKGRGGSGNGIEYSNIGPYVSALEVLQTARNTALQQFYETFKVSDLLRGSSAEYKTATANRLENAWSSLGLIVRQNMFAKFVSDAVNKLGTIIATQFSPEVIFSVADVDTLIQPLLTEGDPQQMQMQAEQMKQEALAAIQGEDRVYRINIATDSMVALDQAQEKADGLDMMKTCGEFFEQMKSTIEQYPPLTTFTMEMMQNVMRRFKGGKDVDGLFQKALAEVKQIVQKKQEEAAKGPPPDPQIMQIEQMREAAQMNFQIQQAKVQMDGQELQGKLQSMQVESQARMAVAQAQVEVEYRKAALKEFVEQQQLLIEQQKLQLEARKLEVETMRIQLDAQAKATGTEAKRETDRFDQILELQRIDIERGYKELDAQEKMMEERRLTNEQELEKVRLAMEAQQAFIQDPSKKSEKK